MSDKAPGNDRAQAGTSAGGAGSTGRGGGLRGTRKVEGAHGQEDRGASGRRSPANKQGLDGNHQTD